MFPLYDFYVEIINVHLNRIILLINSHPFVHGYSWETNLCLSTFTDLLMEKPIIINWKIRNNNNNALVHNAYRLHNVINITQQDNNFTK